MAPYLGLLNRRGELAAPDYTRKDLSEVAFRISPSANDRSLVVLNNETVGWKSRTRWGEVLQLAIFNDVIDRDIIITAPLDHYLDDHDTLEVPRGGLRFEHKFPGDNEPPGGQVDDEVERLRAALKWIGEFQPKLVATARRKFKLEV